jgi:hypothetical protein
LEEDVLNDGFGISDETSSLSEIGEEETRVDESSERETNRILAELAKTASEEGNQRVSWVKTVGVVLFENLLSGNDKRISSVAVCAR